MRCRVVLLLPLVLVVGCAAAPDEAGTPGRRPSAVLHASVPAAVQTPAQQQQQRRRELLQGESAIASRTQDRGTVDLPKRQKLLQQYHDSFKQRYGLTDKQMQDLEASVAAAERGYQQKPSASSGKGAGAKDAAGKGR